MRFYGNMEVAVPTSTQRGQNRQLRRFMDQTIQGRQFYQMGLAYASDAGAHARDIQFELSAQLIVSPRPSSNAPTEFELFSPDALRRRIDVPY